VPVTTAAVHGDDRDRRDTGIDRLRQTLLDAARHDARSILTLAVQRDDRTQRGRLAGRTRDRPIGRHSATRRRDERAVDICGGRGRGCRWRHTQRRRSGRHADTETQKGASIQFGHGGHHAIGVCAGLQ
jgi:hypothetical protein